MLQWGSFSLVAGSRWRLLSGQRHAVLPRPFGGGSAGGAGQEEEERGGGGEGVWEAVAGTAQGQGSGAEVGLWWRFFQEEEEEEEKAAESLLLPAATWCLLFGVWVLLEEYSVWFLGDDFWLVSQNSTFLVRQWIQYMRQSPVLSVVISHISV